MAGKKGRSGNRRIPTALKKLHGTFQKSRAQPNEVQVPLGRPELPERVAGDPEALAEWERVVPLLDSVRVLSDADRSMLASYCAAHSLAIAATAEYLRDGILIENRFGELKAHPMVTVAQKARAEAMRLGLEFGLSPAARSRVSSVPEKPGTKSTDNAEDFLFGNLKLVVK